MLKAFYSRQFERDLKRMIKQGKKGDKIKTVIRKLLNEDKLDSRYRDHKLVGSYQESISKISVFVAILKSS